MKYRLFDIKRRILAVLQKGFPRSENPYKDMAKQAGIEIKELPAVLEDWKHKGKMRRIGTIVDHFKAGLSGEVMVLQQVDADHVAQLGEKLAGFREIKDAYEWNRVENRPYNLYTKVHGAGFQEVEKTVARMSQLIGVSKYRILVTEKELKKVPPTYIIESWANAKKEE